MSLDDLQQEAAYFLGWGRGANASETPWTTSQQTSISKCIDAALRMFYRPTPTDPTQSGYKWSFLYPLATLTLASGHQTMTLPDDYGNIEGDLTISSTDGGFSPIRLIGEGVVREQYSLTPDSTGRPIMATIRPLKGTGLTTGQRFELFVFPQPEQDYTFNFRYYVLLNQLTNARPYPYGGMAHAETIRAAVRASAELMMDGIRGPEYQYFMEQLMASISYDRSSKPQLMGYNRDNSDIYGGQPYGIGRNYWNSLVTYTPGL